MLAAVWLLASCIPTLYAQDEKGCEGVGYTKHPRSEYPPEKLKGRLVRDPKDVDALVHLGLHLEERDQFIQAYALYDRAIEARPSCYLGYYFSGLVGDRISRHAASDAEAKITQALTLNPNLRDDGNVQSFMKWRSPRSGDASSDNEMQPAANKYLAAGNRFFMGVGVGLLFATPFLYWARRKQNAAG